MLPSTSFTPASGFSLLLIGPPLTGKTNTAMLFPDPYFADADDKLANAVQRFPGKRFWYDNLIRGSKNAPIAAHLRWPNAIKLIDEAMRSPDVKVGVVDSLTAIAVFLQDYIIYEMKADPKKLMVAGQQMMTLQYWGPFAQLLRGFIMGLKSYGKPIIVTVHEKDKVSDAGAVIGTEPSISGQLAGQLGSFFTDVWRTETKQVYDTKTQKTSTRYYVRTQPTALISLGNSLGLPAEFDVTSEELAKRLAL